MTYFDFNSSRLLTKRATKQVAIFIILCFVNSFIVSPIFAAEETVFDEEPIPANVREREIIKAPASETKLNERLTAPKKKEALDKRPEFAQNFKVVPPDSERISAGKLSKDKPLTFTPAPVPAGGMRVTMTAYNSEVAQTDASPCITADGTDVCKHGIEDTVAANFLPLGTVIQIPEYFGDRTFVVRDRTNPRYAARVDIWMKYRKDALQFGKRQATIIVVSKPAPKAPRLASTKVSAAVIKLDTSITVPAAKQGS